MHPSKPAPAQVLTSLFLTTQIAITAAISGGCGSRDQRLAEYAQQVGQQQARQNERMADQSEAVARHSEKLATTAHKLVEQDGAARRELLAAQQQLQRQHQAERSLLDRQREQLHDEKAASARAAVREPVIAQAMITAGLTLAALLPLLVTAYALKRLPDPSPTDYLLGQALLDDLVQRGVAPALAHYDTAQRLVGPDERGAGNHQDGSPRN